MYPEVDAYKRAVTQYEEQVNAFGKISGGPYWLPDTVLLPHIQLIPSKTTLIVLTDSGVASAGEGFISYLRQVENVIFIGENTRGAIVFGDVGLHQLPNSKLPVDLGSTLNFPANLEIIEEKGFSPDLWVPADYTLSCLLEAIKKSTI
jgi:C-terminal processing protease CtpA/Prc